MGAVPGSVKQARRLALDYVSEHPDREVLIRRGVRVLERVTAADVVHPGSPVSTPPAEAA